MCELITHCLVKLFEIVAVADHSDLASCWACVSGPVKATYMLSECSVVAGAEVFVEHSGVGGVCRLDDGSGVHGDGFYLHADIRQRVGWFVSSLWKRQFSRLGNVSCWPDLNNFNVFT